MPTNTAERAVKVSTLKIEQRNNCEIEVKNQSDRRNSKKKFFCRVKNYKFEERTKDYTWSSYKGRRANALALGAEEGRGKLRKATGIGKHDVIRRYPNGAIHMESCPCILY